MKCKSGGAKLAYTVQAKMALRPILKNVSRQTWPLSFLGLGRGAIFARAHSRAVLRIGGKEVIFVRIKNRAIFARTLSRAVLRIGGKELIFVRIQNRATFARTLNRPISARTP